MLSAAPEQMDLVAVEIVVALVEGGKLPKEKAAHAHAVVLGVLQEEKALEEEIDREAKELLHKHAGSSREAMDTQAVLSRIKRKLAEEKGVVL
jgi:hypothetical protein